MDTARQARCCGRLGQYRITGTHASTTGIDPNSVAGAAVKRADVDFVSHALRLMECQC